MVTGRHTHIAASTGQAPGADMHGSVDEGVCRKEKEEHGKDAGADSIYRGRGGADEERRHWRLVSVEVLLGRAIDKTQAPGTTTPGKST